jgi:hypothetical protein
MVMYVCEKHIPQKVFKTEQEAMDCESADAKLLAVRKFNKGNLVYCKETNKIFYEIVEPFIKEEDGVKSVWYSAIYGGLKDRDYFRENPDCIPESWLGEKL